jgi:DNA-binding PadR family transcriptional regulator
MNLYGDLLRGHTDMILLAIISEEDSYGYIINKKIQESTNHNLIFTEATLYTSLKRLEASGYIRSYWLMSDSGKRRKYYSITKAGKEYLSNQKKAWGFAKETIDHIIN